ncbi:MAG: Hsp20/alpha crystallin family protein [Longimicrobiaceae bacterium]
MTMLATRPRNGLDPFQELSRMENRFRRLFAEPFELPFLLEPVGWAPAVDVAERNGNLLVTAELPGMTKDDVEVDLGNGVLTISGSKTEETDRKEQAMHIVERSYGSFRRSFTLPCAVDEARVKADYKDGILTVTLPKMAEPEGTKIAING